MWAPIALVIIGFVVGIGRMSMAQDAVVARLVLRPVRRRWSVMDSRLSLRHSRRRRQTCRPVGWHVRRV